jgi:hypothetical protein
MAKHPMQKPMRSWRDLTIAGIAGVFVEGLLALWSFMAQGELTGRHPWLEVSQLPGAQIAEMIAGHASYLAALAFALLFQAILFCSDNSDVHLLIPISDSQA